MNTNDGLVLFYINDLVILTVRACLGIWLEPVVSHTYECMNVNMLQNRNEMTIAGGLTNFVILRVTSIILLY